MFKTNLFHELLVGGKTAATNTENNRKGYLAQNELRKMMRRIPKLFILGLAILMAGCSNTKRIEKNNQLIIQGSGNIISRQLDFTGFDKVETGLVFGLTIRHGEGYNITLVADDNFIDYILVEQDGSTLRLDYKPGYAYDVRGVTMHVDVTMPDLAGLSLGQSSHTWLVDAQSTENFEAELTGSSALEGVLQATTASFHLSGSTYVNLAGSAEQLRLDSCGNSIADLERFAAKDAALEVSCNSKTAVTVTSRLDIDASQHAQVFYYGEPETVNNVFFE